MLFRETLKQLSRQERPTFIKVGANDGVTNDPCSDILLGQQAWRGELFEPVPLYCSRLREAFAGDRFYVVNSAVGLQYGRPLYFVSPDLRRQNPDIPDWVDGIASFDRRHVERHLSKEHIRARFGNLLPSIEQVVPAVYQLKNIVREDGWDPLTFLHIDTEGSDWEVLRSLDWVVEPTVIFIEHEHLSQSDREEMVADLVAHGYTIRDCGSDYFAVKG